MTLTCTLLRWMRSSVRSLRNFSSAILMISKTSPDGRLKFSVENMYKVTNLTLSDCNQSNNRSTVSAPCLCPSHGLISCSLAQRLFPSKMMAMCSGLTSPLICHQSHLSYALYAPIKLRKFFRAIHEPQCQAGLLCRRQILS